MAPGPFPSREGSRRGGGSAGMGGSGAVSPQGAPNKRLLLWMGPGTVGQEHDPGRSPSHKSEQSKHLCGPREEAPNEAPGLGAKLWLRA